MATPVSTIEIIRYNNYRDQGLSVREAARRVGRASSTMHKFDQRRERLSLSAVLEMEFAGPVEDAVEEALREDGTTPTMAAAEIVDLHPSLRGHIRTASNIVARLIARIRSKRA